jgi:hypothetical protein
MAMSQPHEWNDDDRVDAAELEQAMASWDTDGQHDDSTGNDAGAEQAFGHDADVGDSDRQTRSSTTGRTGPH